MHVARQARLPPPKRLHVGAIPTVHAADEGAIEPSCLQNSNMLRELLRSASNLGRGTAYCGRRTCNANTAGWETQALHQICLHQSNAIVTLFDMSPRDGNAYL